jgi:hypothetical protein
MTIEGRRSGGSATAGAVLAGVAEGSGSAGGDAGKGALSAGGEEGLAVRAERPEDGTIGAVLTVFDSGTSGAVLVCAGGT